MWSLRRYGMSARSSWVDDTSSRIIVKALEVVLILRALQVVPKQRLVRQCAATPKCAMDVGLPER